MGIHVRFQGVSKLSHYFTGFHTINKKVFDLCGFRITINKSSTHCLEDQPRTCKWLVTTIYKPSCRPFGRGPTTLLRGLTITVVINHLRPSWDDPPSVCFFVVCLQAAHQQAGRLHGSRQRAGHDQLCLAQRPSRQVLSAPCSLLKTFVSERVVRVHDQCFVDLRGKSVMTSYIRGYT